VLAASAANEIQDRGNGHPQMIGQYHYHDASACLADSAHTVRCFHGRIAAAGGG
jgi:hypothetical protein